MKMLHQRGVLLLTVSIVLAIIGALAFSMSREGGMSAQTVEAQYDTEVARYLAEAGLNLAKWQNEKKGCDNEIALGVTGLPGGTVRTTKVKQKSNGISIDVTGTSNRGAAFQISRPLVILHNLGQKTEETLRAGSGTSDTYLHSDYPVLNMNGSSYLELTQGRSNALLQFSLTDIPTDSMIVKADLKLYQYQSNSTQPAKVVSVHRVLRDWYASSASWTDARFLTPWSVVGGDYDGGNVALATISGNGSYTWNVATLLDGWVKQTIPNYGLLLKPDGPLQQARFASLESNSYSRPSIDVRFYPPCKND